LSVINIILTINFSVDWLLCAGLQVVIAYNENPPEFFEQSHWP